MPLPSSPPAAATHTVLAHGFSVSTTAQVCLFLVVVAVMSWAVSRPSKTLPLSYRIVLGIPLGAVMFAVGLLLLGLWAYLTM